MSTPSARLTDLADLSALVRAPHLHRNAPVKQGPFARDGFCCPACHHYYDPLRLPLGRQPLPGNTGYRQTRSRPPQGRGRGGPLQFPRQPSDRSTPPTPEGSSASAPGSQTPSMAFARSTQARHPLSSRSHGSLDDAAGFASCCGPADCSTPLRRQPLDRQRRSRYQGPWRLPGPDSHRLVAVSFSFGYVRPTSLQSWRPNCWTHVDPGLVVALISKATYWSVRLGA